MRTTYSLDDYQGCFFVIDNFEQLFDATGPDVAPYYKTLVQLPDIAPGSLLAEDGLFDA